MTQQSKLKMNNMMSILKFTDNIYYSNSSPYKKQNPNIEKMLKKGILPLPYYFPQKGGADYTFPGSLSKDGCEQINYNPEKIIYKHIGICKDGDAEFTE